MNIVKEIENFDSENEKLTIKYHTDLEKVRIKYGKKFSKTYNSLISILADLDRGIDSLNKAKKEMSENLISARNALRITNTEV